MQTTTTQTKRLTKEQKAELIRAHSAVMAAKTALASSHRVGSNLGGGSSKGTSPEEREALRAELGAACAARDALMVRYGVA